MSNDRINNTNIENATLNINTYKNILKELENLINLIKGSQKTDFMKNNIYDYSLFPEIIDLKLLKNKIIKIFNTNNVEEIFSFLLKDIYKIFNSDITPVMKNQLKLEFFKIIENLYFFKSYSLIYYFHNSKKNNLPYEYFHEYIIKDNSLKKDEIFCYINFFGLIDILSEEYSTDYNKLLKISDTNKILILIHVLHLQNVFSFKYIIKSIKNFFAQPIRLYSLLLAYSRNIREIKDLINNVLIYNKNNIQPTIISKIFNDNEINDKLDNETKKVLIENIMMNYSNKYITINNNNKEVSELSIYFSIISNNIDIISNNYYINWDLLKEMAKLYLTKDKIKNNFDITINFIKSIKDTKIVIEKIGSVFIDDFIKAIPPNRVTDFVGLFENNNNLIKYLLNKSNKKDGVKLITKLNLQAYDKSYDDFIIKEILNSKYRLFFELHFNILQDFVFINENTYNILMSDGHQKKYNSF